MRVLDLGCGYGWPLERLRATDGDVITGVDVNKERLNVARERFPDRTFLRAKGECLPFADGRFGRVFCALALPYMDIPRALAEVYRVLAPQGSVFLTLHPPRFTLQELFRNALPRPVPTLFRLYVLANGIVFHFTGNNLRFSAKRVESFQTTRGMIKALSRAGFRDIEFSRADGRFIVEARKARGEEQPKILPGRRRGVPSDLPMPSTWNGEDVDKSA